MRSLALLLLITTSSASALSIMSSASSAKALSQFAPQAVSLFNNMKTPAAIVGGAIVPLGFMGPLPLRAPEGVEESKLRKTLRVMYCVVAVMSFASELLTVVWATVTTNKLIETTVAPAETVWDLMKRDYELEWAATNAHFVAGMLGFLFMIGTRMFFHANGGLLGRSLAGLAGASLMLMIAIVNRGVASGSGDGLRYGASVIDLGWTYGRLLLKRAMRPGSTGFLELGALALTVYSLVGVTRVLYEKTNDNNSKGKSD